MIGVPSTIRPTRPDRIFAHETAMCMRPIVEMTDTAPTIERSSPMIALIGMPPNRNSSTRSSGAIMLAVRRPISRTATSRIARTGTRI
jgi:hypothetical protein